MLDENPADQTNETTSGSTPQDALFETAGAAESPAPRKRAPRKTAAKKTAAVEPASTQGDPVADAAAAPAKKTARKRAAKKTAPAPEAVEAPAATPVEAPVEPAPEPAAAPAKKTTRKRAAKKTTPAPEVVVEAPAETPAETPAEPEAAPAKKAAAKRTAAKKTTAKKTAATKTAASAPEAVPGTAAEAPGDAVEVEPAAAPAKKTTRKRAAKKTAPAPVELPTDDGAPAAGALGVPLFQAPEATPPARRRTRKVAEPAPAPAAEEPVEDEDETAEDETAETTEATETAPVETADTDTDENDDENDSDDDSDNDSESSGGGRRRRRRGGRRRRRGGNGGGDDEGSDGEGDSAAEGAASEDDTDETSGDAGQGEGAERRSGRGGRGRGGRGQKQDDADKGDESADGDDATDPDGATDAADSDGDEGGSSSTRRRRRRRRSGDSSGGGNDDPENTVTKVRQGRSIEDEITAVSGSTRLEAKKQRRREGREAGRRRAPIASEAEFLARREAVERVMVVRQKEDLTQIAVLEDKVLVEHYVARESQTSIIGNVYVGRVQNVLPSMEAAFIDIGKGRNAVLYAGEVNWSSLGHKDGQPRKIESVLSSGQTVLVQVTKDPVGHKGARLTSQVSLAGRFLVYVPDGTTSGISRKLPDTERARLKALLKEIVPPSAGVIVRTAAEGASEEELTRDVERLKARWEEIEAKASGKGGAPQLLYGEPDLTLKVVRDLFTEDFAKLVVEGEDAWQTVSSYVEQVAPDLADRLEQHVPDPTANISKDVFERYRIDEQIAKGLDRKVWLPSGGSLIIDRTEAMTVVDVNTGKFTGSGGNLEETVTKNNLEAAEEMVRQLRLRDIGGIIVIDFIDMVLENNRDLVLRRLVECLGRDRTRHQVAEVTSLGLVQMTRKRIGTGLVEAFSENCTHCQGRGLVIHDHPVEPKGGNGGGNGGNGGGNGGNGGSNGGGNGGGDNGDGERRSGRRRGRGRGGEGSTTPTPAPAPSAKPNPAEIAAVARIAAASGHAAPADDDAAVEPVEPVEPEQPVETAPEPVEPESEPAAPVVRSVQRTTRRATVVTTREAVVLTVDPDGEPAAPVAAPAPSVTVVTRTRQPVVPPAPSED